jgi:ligand-binding SRPBCC domain-containing protein
MARLFVLRDEVVIRAPRERCFLLSTSIELVQLELSMKPVRGRTHGLVVKGDTVLWRGWKFGLPQFHLSLIEDYRAPSFFRDRMIAGRFRTFEHDHAFDLQPDGSVRLRDEIRFSMRWGWLGQWIGHALLVPHTRTLMRRRFARIRQLAESESWRQFAPESTP